MDYKLPPFLGASQPLLKRTVSLPLVAIFILVSLVVGVVAGSWGENIINKGGSGMVTGLNTASPNYLKKDVDFSLYWKIWEYVHNNYLDKNLSDTKIFYGSLAGLVAGLDDPYSVFMDPSTTEKFNQELQGEFDGIGAEIGVKDNRIVVIAPLPNTPAEKAGLKPGDRILGIDNVDTTGMAVDYAVSLIRGLKGSKVKLIIQPSGLSEPKEVAIVRDRIVIQLIKSELKDLPDGRGKVAYIRLVHFSADADNLFKETWQRLAAAGPKGLIFDLRSNPGGYLDQAIAISSHWIDQGVVVKEKGASIDQKDYESTGEGDLKEIPTVILVNQGSASASEIVTGALQDYGLATVVGEQTFGKGSVQNLEDFADGSSVKLTIAKWYTPKDRSIDKNGLKPDIEVKITPEDIAKNLDPQLDKALQLLAK